MYTFLPIFIVPLFREILRLNRSIYSCILKSWYPLQLSSPLFSSNLAHPSIQLHLRTLLTLPSSCVFCCQKCTQTSSLTLCLIFLDMHSLSHHLFLDLENFLFYSNIQFLVDPQGPHPGLALPREESLPCIH